MTEPMHTPSQPTETRVSNCVQCQREMTESYGNYDWCAPFCNYPDCPNYGLLQTGILPNKPKE